MSDRVTITVTDGIADVRLNRPEKLNALDGEMFAAVGEAARTVGADPSVRVVVLSGEGRGFCAGIDLDMFTAPGGVGGIVSEPAPGERNRGQQASLGWHDCPVPVIAAVHGAAIGGGFQIALGADIRIASPDAKLGLREAYWGIFPDMGGTQLLTRLVRHDIARELIYTARIVSGEEGFALGLVTRLSDDPRGAAMQLAAEIADNNPDAIRAAKRLLNQVLAPGLDEGLEGERREVGKLLGSSNQSESILARVEKRKPRFTDGR
ncbi:MAG: crotonase/enoyl-CoA hydratase family protein [Acidimicrobiia bacterium]